MKTIYQKAYWGYYYILSIEKEFIYVKVIRIW